MKLVFCLMTLLLCGGLRAAPAVRALPRPDAPDLGSPFLRVPARSLVQLTRQVQHDAVARRRYARYFHVPEAQVTPYMRRNLFSGTLSHAGRYTVFFISTSGVIYPTQMTLPSGTPVFAARNGTPVLLRGTGNPLKPFAPAVETQYVDAPPPRSGGTQEKIVPAAPADISVPAAPPTR